MNRAGKGFTIVELLIVIVVIAILAAVTIVSYNGITNQASDTAIKSDLATLKKKVELYKVENGNYPSSNAALDSAVTSFRASKGNYMVRPTTDHNLIYCNNTGPAPDYTVFDYTFVAYSKSGKKFRISKNSSIEEYTTTWTNQTVACQDSMPTYTNNYRGYAGEDTTTGPWRSWAGGN